MTTSLDMSLDDMIKSNHSSGRGGGRGRGRSQRFSRGRGGVFSAPRGRGMNMPFRRPLGVTRPSSQTIAKSFSRAKDLSRRPDLFEDSMRAAGLSGVETGTRLYVSNLHYGVSSEDIKELFGEVGSLKHYAVHYDRSARSTGSAEVTFFRRSDAIAALKRYNNVQLDGKPMKIEVVGESLGIPVAPRVNVAAGPNGRERRTVVMMPEFGKGAPGPSIRSPLPRRGGFHGGRGRSSVRGSGVNRGRISGHSRGRGRGRGQRQQQVPVSAEQLDKDLETYHSGAV